MFQKSRRNQWGHHSSEARNLPRRSHYYHRKSFSDFSCSCHYPIWWRITQVWFCLDLMNTVCTCITISAVNLFCLAYICQSTLVPSRTLQLYWDSFIPALAQEWLLEQKFSNFWHQNWYDFLWKIDIDFLSIQQDDTLITRCQATHTNKQFTLRIP